MAAGWQEQRHECHGLLQTANQSAPAEPQEALPLHPSAVRPVTGLITEDIPARSAEHPVGDERQPAARPLSAVASPGRLSFAAANTVAVLAALYVAFALDLERPYWAMFTVFIVANPIAGAVRSKAVYRILGTLAGASISLLLIPPLVDAPVVLCLAMSLWVGACLYLSLQDRTPRSYTFLLAGYTATIVGLAVVDSPLTIFNTAVSRVEEISLGVICAAIAHSVIFPQSVTVELNRKIQTTLSAAGAWLSESLMSSDPQSDVRAQQRLATIVNALHLSYTYVAFETSDVPRAGGLMRLLQERLGLLLPRLSGIQKAVAALSTSGPVPASVVSAVAATSRWLRWGEPAEPLLFDQGYRASPVDPAAPSAQGLPRTPSDWRGLLELSALTNLRELTTAFGDSKLLATRLTSERAKLPGRLEREAATARRPSLHRDRGLALLSAFAAAGATLVACLLWIEGSWPEGAVAAQFAAIGCSLSATLDSPAKLIRPAIIGILIALPLAALYEFAILPRADGFVSLALVLSPAILLFSLMLSSARLGGAGLVLAVAFSGGLALQETYRADFAAFVNSNSAEVVGLLVALAMSLVFRTIDPAWNARRISRSGRKAVRRLATDSTVDLPTWTIEMTDRLVLVNSRINAAARVNFAREDMDELRDLRVGLNIGRLRAVCDELECTSRSALQGVLDTVSRIYSSRPGGARTREPIEEAIDQGISVLGGEAPSRPARDGLAALTGLRLDLARADSQYEIPHSL